jgi:hypothetical protein
MGVQKNEEDNKTQHIVYNENLNHINIYNVVFSQ